MDKKYLYVIANLLYSMSPINMLIELLIAYK